MSGCRSAPTCFSTITAPGFSWSASLSTTLGWMEPCIRPVRGRGCAKECRANMASQSVGPVIDLTARIVEHCRRIASCVFDAVNAHRHVCHFTAFCARTQQIDNLCTSHGIPGCSWMREEERNRDVCGGGKISGKISCQSITSHSTYVYFWRLEAWPAKVLFRTD